MEGCFPDTFIIYLPLVLSVMITGVKSIKGRFLVGLLFLMVCVIKIVLEMLWDVGIYLEYDIYAPVNPYSLIFLISLFTNIIGIIILLNTISKVKSEEKNDERSGLLIFIRIDVILLIFPTVYYIGIRLGIFWYANFLVLMLIVDVFNYFYLVVITFLVYSIILLLRDS